MKFEKISLISLPIIVTAVMLYVGVFDDLTTTDDQSLVTNNQKEKALDQYHAKNEEKYNKKLEAGFDTYATIYEEEKAVFKNKIEKQWGEFKNSSESEWVSYVNQGKIRRSVNYETGEVSVELIDSEERTLGNIVKRTLEKQIFALLNSTEDSAFKTDQVAQKVEERLPVDFRMVKRGLPSEERLFSFDDLVSVTFNYDGISYVSNKIGNLVKQDVRKAEIPGKRIIRSSFTIKKSVLRKAVKYADTVQKMSEKQKIPSALIYAIMESESSFNPMAKSHIPAYGLMQIVPRSAGKDATKHLYGRAKILAPSYLYRTDNNINVGAAYLHVLYYKYLRKVKDPQSRIYLTIAAYNSGASSVARAFIKTKNFSRAVTKINKMTSAEVYQALVEKLPYKETREYVEKVSIKMKKYENTHPLEASV